MKKSIQTLIAVIITVMTFLGAAPMISYAAPASDIPAAMLDNDYLDALEYTGYKVQKQKDSGTIFKKYAYSVESGILSGIDYDNSFVTDGIETVSGSSKTGKVPNISRFKSTGLCCASYVSYVYFNYLPNIKGYDMSKLARPDNYKSAPSYAEAAEKWVKSGAAKKISFTQSSNGKTFSSSENIPIGSLIVFKQNGSASHVALYAGYYNGKHFVTHTGNSRGPEISTIEEMEKNGSMELVSAIYKFTTPPGPTPQYCRLTVQKTDGKTALSGAEFKVQQAVFADDGSFTWKDYKTLTEGTTNGSPRYFATDLEYTYGTGGNHGWFKLVETKAPTGYKKDPTFKINAQSADGEYEKTHMFTDGRFHYDPNAGASDNFLFYFMAEDPPVTCRVTVMKRDAATKKKLDGAAFKVQQAVFAADGSYSWKDYKTLTVKSQSDGTVRYYAEGLEYSSTNRGWFKVVETKAPAGYKLMPTFTANDQTDNVNYENEYRESDGAFKFDPAHGAYDNYSFYYIADDPQDNGSCKIIKTSDDGKVSGIQFTVTGDGYNQTVTTGSDGTFLLEGLKPGTYTVTEKVPAGYTSKKATQTVTVKANETAEVKFENELIKGNCKIIKTSDDGNVSGIQFTVKGDGYSNTVTTGSDGTFLIEGLKPGTYTVTEKVPAGYKCKSKNPQTVTVKGGETATVTFENNLLYGNIELTKVDEEYPDNKLTGAEFTVTIVKDGKTTTQKMKEVSTGVYRLEHIAYNSVCTIRETKAPEGFLLSNESFKVTILEEKTYTVASKNFDSVTNRPIKGSLKIVKMNRGDAIPLEGAGFRLFNAKGEKVAEGYTDADGELLFEGLRYGKYTYREFKAPKGFTLDDTEYEFEITTDGKVIEARRINDPILGSITVHKTNENGNALAGAVFLCEWSTDGKTFSPIRDRGIFANMAAVGTCTNKGIKDGTLTVGSDGVVKFEGLRIYDADGKDVIYRITEIKAPKGYQLLKEPAFEGKINADGSGEETEFTVVNSHIYVLPAAGSMQIIYVGASIGVALLSAALISTIIIYRRKHNNKNK